GDMTIETTHLTTEVPGTITPATGNVLEDDTLGSNYTAFEVDTGDGTFVEVVNGTVVDGQYGTLTINADGSYTYDPDATLDNFDGVDVFTYQLVHPNGTTETATLSITVERGVGPDVSESALATSEAELDFDQFDESGSDI